MASLDFDLEKNRFREHYDRRRPLLEGAMESLLTLIRSLLASSRITTAKIEGRLKHREECIKKFNRKYRSELEDSATAYQIQDHISDLIGLRIVCLYEDEIEAIKNLMTQHFALIAETDKIAQIEGTENAFGYKGLHLDLRLNDERLKLPEYAVYGRLSFELQIRTVVQDSWSILDHKIKYKKSIPGRLKRRINTLAALFELADREFREIRDATAQELAEAEAEAVAGEATLAPQKPIPQGGDRPSELLTPRHSAPLNAFRLLKIVNHFFPDFDFKPHKVDGFTEEIIHCQPDISREEFNDYMKRNISTVKRYKDYFETQHPGQRLNAYAVIRHCLYAAKPATFGSLLNNSDKQRFEARLAKGAA